MVKTLILGAGILVVAATSVLAQDQYTNGYERKDGTYVQGYYHTAPDGDRFNNYSTRGNENPYTGKMGTVNPYGSSPYASPGYGPAPEYAPPVGGFSGAVGGSR